MKPETVITNIYQLGLYLAKLYLTSVSTASPDLFWRENVVWEASHSKYPTSHAIRGRSCLNPLVSSCQMWGVRPNNEKWEAVGRPITFLHKKMIYRVCHLEHGWFVWCVKCDDVFSNPCARRIGVDKKQIFIIRKIMNYPVLCLISGLSVLVTKFSNLT